MDRSGIKRIVSAIDSQETSSLNKGRVAESTDLLKVLAIFKRSILFPEFADSFGRKRVHSRDEF